VTRRAAVRRRLDSALARASLVGELGVAHSFHRWEADRLLDGRATRRLDAFVERMWAEAAEAVGATVTKLDASLYEFRRGDAVTRVAGQRTPFANPVAGELASAKDLASRALRRAGVPVPEQAVVSRDEIRAARALLESAGGPLVVKPARDGAAGQGVTTSVMTTRQLERAIRRAAQTSPSVLVEREVAGDHFRILLLDGEVLDVLRRRRPSVIGDGISTIERLMFAEYRRRLNDERSWKPFPVDLDCLFTLELQGMSLASVPAQGEEVVVKGATNISGRRECTTFTGEIAGEVVAIVRQAAAALGVRLAGVDLVTTDISVPVATTGGAVLEVNPVPGLFHHYNVANEERVSRVAIPILEALLTEGAP
jgi:cyanophycin synthetase